MVTINLFTHYIMQETFVCADEFGSDLEHVEVLQRKFDEFQKDMAAQEYRVTEVNQLAERLVLEGHPERETIVKRKDVSNDPQPYLNALPFLRPLVYRDHYRVGPGLLISSHKSLFMLKRKL